MSTVPARWRKSSYSAQETNCVELAHTLTAVRDSKNPTGAILWAPVGHLIAAARAGQLSS